MNKPNILSNESDWRDGYRLMELAALLMRAMNQEASAYPEGTATTIPNVIGGRRIDGPLAVPETPQLSAKIDPSIYDPRSYMGVPNASVYENLVNAWMSIMHGKMNPNFSRDIRRSALYQK